MIDWVVKGFKVLRKCKKRVPFIQKTFLPTIKEDISNYLTSLKIILFSDINKMNLTTVMVPILSSLIYLCILFLIIIIDLKLSSIWLCTDFIKCEQIKINKRYLLFDALPDQLNE